MNKEQLIWEYLDNPKDMHLQSKIDKLAENDPSILSLIDQFILMNDDLKSIPKESIDPDFSEEMTADILRKMSTQKGKGWSDIQFWSFILCSIILSSLALTYLTGQEISMNNWAANWKNSIPNLEGFRSLQIDLNLDIQWNLYLFIVIPFVLYFMDWIFMNNVKLSKNTNLIL